MRTCPPVSIPPVHRGMPSEDHGLLIRPHLLILLMGTWRPHCLRGFSKATGEFLVGWKPTQPTAFREPLCPRSPWPCIRTSCISVLLQRRRPDTVSSQKWAPGSDEARGTTYCMSLAGRWSSMMRSRVVRTVTCTQLGQAEGK